MGKHLLPPDYMKRSALARWPLHATTEVEMSYWGKPREIKVRTLIGAPLSRAESTFISHTIAWIVFGLVIVNIIAQVIR